ncbi:hypothetical protein CsSME_00022861 [Camellia sinensis var. sinensis]
MHIDDHCFLQCFYLATSYSLAGKRTEAYALYCRAHSLANDALKKFKSLTTADQNMQQELEEEKAPENLSKKISTISLTGADKEVPFSLGFSTCLS